MGYRSCSFLLFPSFFGFKGTIAKTWDKEAKGANPETETADDPGMNKIE